MSKLKMAIYSSSPVWMQNCLCTCEGVRLGHMRYGKEFDRWAVFYEEAASWSEAELSEYQREQMIELVRYCFAAVPYYRQKWGSAGLSGHDFSKLEDLAKLPCTTKEELFQNRDQMRSDQYHPDELVKGMTGGSTGMPLVRYFTRGELQRHYAIFWGRMRQGVQRGDRYAAFQGKEIVPQTQKSPPYWRENYAANQRLYSMRHLSPESLRYYTESLVDEPFVYYQGYVSIMSIMAEYMKENNSLLTRPPKAVFTTSEQLTRETRRLLETVWQTKVWDEYCQGERCALIRQCEYGYYHPQLDYGIVEFEPIGDEGDNLLAEIICTGFIPHAAPLVRYRVGDRVLLERSGRCRCGAPGPVIRTIRGRTADVILTPDGRKYPHISLIVDMLHNVRCMQVVQERADAILVRIVPFPQFSSDDERLVVRCFRERLGGDMDVLVEKVSELERTASGKVLSIINRIPGRAHRGSGSDD